MWMDSYNQRFFIEHGPADDLAAIGWEVEGPADLELIAGRVTELGDVWRSRLNHALRHQHQ